MYSGYQEEQDNARKNVLGGVLGLGLLAAAPFGAQAILKNRMAKKGKLSDIPNARGGQSGVRTTKKELNKFMNDIEAGSLEPDYRPTSGPISGPNKGKTWGMNKDYYQASQEGVKLLTDPKTGEMYSPGGTRSPIDLRNRNSLQYLEAPAATVGPSVQFRDYPGQPLALRGKPGQFIDTKSNTKDLALDQFASSLEAPAGKVGPNVLLKDIPLPSNYLEAPLQTYGPSLRDISGLKATQGPAMRPRNKTDLNRLENQASVIIGDLQNEAALEREANAVLKDLRQSQVRDAAQDAIQTAENQADAKVYRKLRRDEDLDMNRTNIDYVQSFMTDRRIELANKGVTGKRAERILASDPNIKNAIELYAQTGDPNVFQLTRKNPSMPMQLEPQDSSFVTDLSALGKAEVDTGLFMKKDKRGAFTDPIEQREIDLVNQRGQIEERQNELRGRINQINEDENMLRAAAERTPRKGLSGQNEFDFMVNKLRQEREGLKDEGIQNAEKLFDVKNNLSRTRFELAAEEEFGGRAEPKTFTGEPKRLFFEADPETGKPLSGTFEVRSDREMKDMEAKGGGGRNVANYAGGSALEEEVRNIQQGDRKVRVRDADEFGNAISDFEGDRTQTGSVTGIYGIERGDTSTADPVVKPSTVLKASTPYQDLDDETLSMISLMGKGADAELATKESMRRKRADTSGESLKVSEGLRRARIEGRDPQSVLRRFGVVQ